VSCTWIRRPTLSTSALRSATTVKCDACSTRPCKTRLAQVSGAIYWCPKRPQDAKQVNGQITRQWCTPYVGGTKIRSFEPPSTSNRLANDSAEGPRRKVARPPQRGHVSRQRETGKRSGSCPIEKGHTTRGLTKLIFNLILTELIIRERLTWAAIKTYYQNPQIQIHHVFCTHLIISMRQIIKYFVWF